MELVSMERPRPKKEAKADMACEPTMYYEKYGYGMSIHLETEEINKLDIDLKKCRAGDEVMIYAKAKITEVEERETSDDRTGKMKVRKGLRLQITNMDLKKEAPSSNSLTRRGIKATSNKDSY